MAQLLELPQDSQLPVAHRVRIEVIDSQIPKGRIVIEGQNAGEVRRALVVFLRLVDRKYPHVGRLHPLSNPYSDYPDWDTGQPVPYQGWMNPSASENFFANFTPDLKFLVKPLLDEADDDTGLYANDTMDFAGRYTMRFSPYIFEPTYADGFIYNYPGPYHYDKTWVDNEITPVTDSGYPGGPGPYSP